MASENRDFDQARSDFGTVWEDLALRPLHAGLRGEPLVYRADYLTIVEDPVDSDADRRTRLERMLAGDEPDVYAAHRQTLDCDWSCFRENDGSLFDDPDPELASKIRHVRDLGRRIYRWAGRWCIEDDTARGPAIVDDPSGDDVAADAPRCPGIGGGR